MSVCIAAGSAGWCRRILQEVVAQGASGAFAVVVDFAFLFAGFAGEVAGDPGAGEANWARVGVVSSAV